MSLENINSFNNILLITSTDQNYFSKSIMIADTMEKIEIHRLPIVQKDAGFLPYGFSQLIYPSMLKAIYPQLQIILPCWLLLIPSTDYSSMLIATYPQQHIILPCWYLLIHCYIFHADIYLSIATYSMLIFTYPYIATYYPSMLKAIYPQLPTD